MIERASYFSGPRDEAIRFRCRNAPAFIRANIDANRESAGLAPLWPGLEKRSRRSLCAKVAALRAFVARTSARLEAAK